MPQLSEYLPSYLEVPSLLTKSKQSQGFNNLTSIHQYLVWASLAALCLAFVLSFLLTRRVLQPLSQMTAITKELIEAHGGSIGAKTGPNDTHIWLILPS